MKRKIFFLIIIVVFAIIFSFMEIKIIEKNFDKEIYSKIYFVKNDISFGEQLKEKDIILIETLIEDGKNYFFEEDKNMILNKVATRDIKKGEVLLKNCFCKIEENKFVTKKGNILITLELDPVSSNAWNLRKNQKINLIFCPESNLQIDDKYRIYKDVIVKNIYDSLVCELEYKDNEKAKYITIEIEENNGYELISFKNYGRIEIVIL